MDFLLDYQIWVGFLSLAALEVVLGIDNVVFIALLTNHLPSEQGKVARSIGLGLALGFRVLMLFALVWIVQLTKPIFSFWQIELSGKDILMLIGGLFLLYKATTGVHDELSGDKREAYKSVKSGLIYCIVQISVIDFVFSFDSVITAIGMTSNLGVIISAMAFAVFIMLISAGYVADFIAAHPTVKVLALSFVMMIGLLLVAEGLGVSVPKGYIYFGMAFSLFVESLNTVARWRKKTAKS